MLKKALDKSVEAGNKIDKATKGKKTYTVGGIMGAFQMLMLLFPNLIKNNNIENAIEYSIGSGLLLTVSDVLIRKIWKNRKIIWEYTKKPFRWIKRRKKSPTNAEP